MTTPLDKKLADMAREAAEKLCPVQAYTVRNKDRLRPDLVEEHELYIEETQNHLAALMRSAIREAIDESGAVEALDEFTWNGRGENAHEEYYCHCCHEHAPNDADIPHKPSCKAATALAKLRALTQP